MSEPEHQQFSVHIFTRIPDTVAYLILRDVTISASSAQSERDFSSVGRTVADARSQVFASKVKAID